MDVLGLSERFRSYYADARNAKATGQSQLNCGYRYNSCNFSLTDTLIKNFDTNNVESGVDYNNLDNQF